LINASNRESQLDAVSPDHRAIGFNAARQLFAYGHRRILTITTLRRDTLYVRLEGIKEAYRHFHVPFNAGDDLLVTEGFGGDEAAERLAQWLDARPASQWPQALLCGSADMTAGIQRLLAQRGVRVPQDLALMSTDVQALLDASVTGIAVPCRELGVEAVHLLQTRLNRPQAPVFNLLLPGRLVEAGTVSQATRHAAQAFPSP